MTQVYTGFSADRKRDVQNSYFLPLGKPRWPRLPQFCQMEDRDDPTVVWTLIFDRDAARIGISDQAVPRKSYGEITYYPAEQGIWMGKGVRVFVRGGRIGYEVVNTPRAGTLISPQPTARRGLQHYVLSVKIPLSYENPGDLLAWEETYNG